MKNLPRDDRTSINFDNYYLVSILKSLNETKYGEVL